MIPVKKLIELLEKLPADAAVVAYEGERTGLSVSRGKRWGWIETGHGNQECDHSKTDLSRFKK